MAEEENIKVVVRIRDLIPREKGQEKVFSVMDAREIVRKGTDKSWTFDRVYNPVEDNRAVYADTVGQMIEDTVNGFNSTVFAYGQTSSGKTHTMYGAKGEEGVIDMAVNQLFYAMEETPNRKFLVMASFIEIYNESVVDLLADQKTNPQGGLKIRENGDGDVYVENLEEKIVSSQDDIYNYMKEGEKSRKVGSTNMNERSSRSHTIFRLRIESSNRLSDDETITEEEEDEGEQIMQSQLNLVDLAGSERAAQTGAGGVRLKEGCNINQSLMTLGQVIQKLSSGGSQHIPYRDSKLTRILQNSLGGNAKTAIICTVTPAAMSEEQTISTLRFASEAKKITNHAKVNEILDHQGQISKLKKEMEELRKELDAQRKINTNEMMEELREKFERERNEKELKMKEIENLQMKVITSSQPAPPRKSMMVVQSRKTRRETWCGPNMRKAMRQSLAPSAFRALPDFDSSSSSTSFKFSPTSFEEHLNSQENDKLNELEEDETIWLKCTPSPVVRKKRKTVGFVQSPQFLSPRKFKNPNFDLNCTDDGATPKAVIRDKYKRISLALSDREMELERERQERLEVETELQELQEFTRLEDESGVYNENKVRVDEVCEGPSRDRMRSLEKSCQDSEQIILDLRKCLQEEKNDNVILSSKLQDTEERLGKVTETEQTLSLRVQELEPLISEVKLLKEKSEALERNKEDFDMEMELALKKKETAINDLRKYLESAYEEIALNENSNKDQIKKRYGKVEELQKQVELLKEELRMKETLLAENTTTDPTSSVGEEVLAEMKEKSDKLASDLEETSKRNDELEREVKLLTQTIAENDEELQGFIQKNSSFENALMESQRSNSEKDEMIMSLNKENASKLQELQTKNLLIEDDCKTIKENYKAAQEEKIKIEEEFERLKEELKELKHLNEGEEKASEDNAGVIREKNVIIEDLKLCVEEQSKENEDLQLELERVQKEIIDSKESSKKTEDALMELEDAKKEIDEFKGRLKENEEVLREIEKVREENAHLKEGFHGKANELEAALVEKEELRQEVATLTDTNSEHEEELQCLLQRNSSFENALMESKKSISERELTISDLEEKVGKLTEELQTFHSTVSSKDAAAKTLETEQSDLMAKLQNTIHELETSREKNDLLEKKTKSLLDVNSKSEGALKNLVEKIASLDEELSELKLDLENSYKVKENLSVANQDLLQQISTLTRRVEDSESKLSDQTSLKRELEESNLKLNEELENLKLISSSATSSQAQQFQEISQKLSLANDEKIKIEDQLTKTLFDLSSLQEVNVLLQNDHSKLSSDVSRVNQENENLNDQLSMANGDKIKIEDQLNKMLSDFSLLQQEKEILQNDLMKGTKQISEVSQENENLHCQLSLMNDAKVKIEDQYAKSVSDFSTLRKEKEVLENDLVKFTSDLSRVNEHNENLNGKLAKMTSDLLLMTELKESLDDEVGQMNSRLSSAALRKEELEEAQIKMSSDFSLVRVEKDKLDSELTRMTSDLASANEERENLHKELSKATSDLSQIMMEKEILNNEVAKVTSRLSSADQEKLELEFNLTKITEDLTKVSEEKVKFQDQVSQMVSDLASANQEKENLLDRISVISSELATRTKEFDEIQAKLTLSSHKTDSQVQTLVQKVQVLEDQTSEAAKAMSEKVLLIEVLQSTNEEHLKEIDNAKFLLTEAENQRDMVDAACDKLEVELQQTKTALEERESQIRGLTENDCNVKEFKEKNDLKVKELSEKTDAQKDEIENLKFFLKEVQSQNDEANEACDKAEEELKEKMKEIEKLKEKTLLLEEKVFLSEKEKENSNQTHQINQLREALASAKEELGQKNIELASIKVDVERGELEYKKKCDILQVDLEYEKGNNARLTQEIRRQQSSSLDTTVLGAKRRTVPSVASGQTQQPQAASTSTESDLAVWSSGSGALKEMRLLDLQVKTKSLEKDNSRLKEHEEFYINKAREWKNRALRYEKFLKEKGYEIPSRDTKKEGKENTSTTAGSSQVVQDSKEISGKTAQAQPPTSPTIQLNLHQPREARRTEEDFLLPKSSKRNDECKTQ